MCHDNPGSYMNSQAEEMSQETMNELFIDYKIMKQIVRQNCYKVL